MLGNSRQRNGRAKNRADVHDLSYTRRRNLKDESLILVRNRRMKRKHQEILRSKRLMTLEQIAQLPDRLERRKEDENSGREGNEGGFVEAETFEKEENEVVIDRVMVHAVDRESGLFRDVGDVGGSFLIAFVVVWRNIVLDRRFSWSTAKVCHHRSDQRCWRSREEKTDSSCFERRRENRNSDPICSQSARRRPRANER